MSSRVLLSSTCLLRLSPRVKLWDRPPRLPLARRLGTAFLIGTVQPASSTARGDPIDAAKVAYFMPAVCLRAVQLEADAGAVDYTAMELLYNTDAYMYLIQEHFTSKQLRPPVTLKDLLQNKDKPALMFLWDRRHLSYK